MILTLIAALAHAPAPQDTTYVRQGVDYRVEARLDESTHVLRGRARLRYTNRSRAALDTIYLHQYLNAFRPNSAWARRELQYGERRFQDLGPVDHAYERFTRVEVDGRAVRPAYPGAPDSTVAAIPLPRPLAPGATATVVMDWDARLSTLPRRQGRSGRNYSFAQWYPRVAVYERGEWVEHPLLPQGEFYGEFGAYDVTLDVAADQVIGATGVAVEGDPGYRVSASELAFYAAKPADALGLLEGAPAAGRKRVRFRAEDVHHFAWAADPAFRHDDVTRFAIQDDGTRRELPTIHVLYPPGEAEWAQASRRTYDALVWLQGVFGPYPWPQLTNVRRPERGGTEFPMMMMNGSASEGLIMHETTHQWPHGILASNEWREAWLDEGFTNFITNWYLEEATKRPDVWTATMRILERRERSGDTQPLDLPSALYRDPSIYVDMSYAKGEAVFRMLRYVLGDDAFRRVLRTYHERYRLKRVTGADFQRVAEEVGGRDLDWFFDQWVRRTDGLDYSVADASTRRLPDGRWQTRVVVRRVGEAWMPVDVRVGNETRRVEGRERQQTVDFITAARPGEAWVDPEWILIDPDRGNNRASLR